ncbi:Heterogeneous nuclear ribonucleoprotein Q [Linum perenne]
MPRPRDSATDADRHDEPESSMDSETEEQVDLDDDNDEEQMEEEIEYEEVEEEVEEDEEEEEVEEEVEEDDEETVNDEEEDKERKHAELLALPPHGSEVYLGGIPHNVSENDLRRFCESVGKVTEVRIMKGKESGEGKGYAFVTFRTKELATRAMKDLNNSDFKGKKVKCSASQANHRLFIGNVPRTWGEEDMKKVARKIGPGVISVDMLKDPQNPSRNRGFAFIEYYNHACAEYSRKEMSNPEFKLDENSPTVSWADPKNAGSSAPSQVKAIYVKNLPKDITQDQLKQLFEHHGKIIKVVLPPAKPGHERSRFGFVHFSERSSAMKALKNTEKYEIDGRVLDCSLAKPQADNKPSGGTSSQKPAVSTSFPPRLGYGLVGNPYGALGGFGAAGFPQSGGLLQPMFYGAEPTPAGMAMMPMFLPDGRVGYVLQQPAGIQPHHIPIPLPRSGGRGGGGSSSSSGRGKRYSDSYHGRGRYNPY